VNRKMRAKLANRIARERKRSRESTPRCKDCGDPLVPVGFVVLEPFVTKPETLH
jgi:transposase